jgi:hypothetical protein
MRIPKYPEKTKSKILSMTIGLRPKARYVYALEAKATFKILYSIYAHAHMSLSQASP